MKQIDKIYKIDTVNGVEEISVTNTLDSESGKPSYTVLNISTDENEGLYALLSKDLVFELIEKLSKLAKEIEK